MSLSDPIGDMIARVKNAQARNHKKVELPSSNFKTKIADILKNEGYIKDFKINNVENKSILSLELKYHSGNPVISAFEEFLSLVEEFFLVQIAFQKLIMGLVLQLFQLQKV